MITQKMAPENHNIQDSGKYWSVINLFYHIYIYILGGFLNNYNL